MENQPTRCLPAIQPMTRRGLLKGAPLGLTLAMGRKSLPASSQMRVSDPAPEAALQALNRFPQTLQTYFTAEARRIEKRSLEVKAALQSAAQAEVYIREVRQKIQRCFGPFPARTPLNPRVTGVLERDAYRIEKIIFESRPGFLVTANLYLPRGRRFPLPGVVGSCGHADTGKASETYQAFAQGLARMGYVVLIFDPIGQGERLQYPSPDRKSRIGIGVREHLYAGNPQFLVGEFFGAWRAWDGIRALDYLLSRPEVDRDHVGVTGNSGGGTLTTWLCGLDQRWAMAAPGCFVTTFRRNLENELPADVEQCPPRALAVGLDHDDFLAALAPKPVIILAKEKDYFDIRGAEEAFARLKRLYRLLGAEDRVALSVAPSYHGYSKDSREPMYRWFNRFTGVSDAVEEPALTFEKEGDLWCTPGGQVADLNSRSVPAFTREQSRAFEITRLTKTASALRAAVSALLRLPDRIESPDYRILRPLRSRGYPARHCACYALETEPHLQVIVYQLANEEHYSRPSGSPDRAILYVSHRSADTELREEPLVSELIAADPGAVFFACDLRGIGETQPNTCGLDTYSTAYGSDYFYAIHSIMLDRSMPAQRTFDLLGVLAWLKSHGYKRLHLAALGRGTIPATFAAVVCEEVVEVTLKNALTSYAALVESEDYSWPLSSFQPDILKQFDLTDCYRFLAEKRLRQLDMAGPSL